MTNETLEELGRFAERKYLERLNNYENCDFSDGVIAGAKWMQERMYTLEQISKDFIGEEGQSGYFDDWLDYRLDSKNKLSFREWFEKFKKDNL
jgi:hypothetical protein